MNYADNQYRVVHTADRQETVKTFSTLDAAQEFSRYGTYEIQRAIEAEDGSVYEWQSTALSMSPRYVAGRWTLPSHAGRRGKIA